MKKFTSKKFIKILIPIFLFLVFFTYAENQVWLWTAIIDNDETVAIDFSDFSLQLIKIHYKISNIPINIVQKETLSDSSDLWIINKLQQLGKTDLIAILDVAWNKQKALIWYLDEVQNALDKSANLIISLNQEINWLNFDMNTCLSQKSQSDKTFFDSLNSYDELLMKQAMEESIKYWECASNNRIKLNAKTAMLDKLNFYNNILQQKYDFIISKQDMIVKNYSVIKYEILQQLNEISSVLDSYKWTD